MVPIVSYPSKPLAAPLAALLARCPESDCEVEDAVRGILQQVREEGDAALCALTQCFDGVEVCPGQLRVPASVLVEAEAALDPGLRVSMAAAVANIRAFHERQKLNSWFVEDGDGVVLGKKITPIERVGLCVPAGEGATVFEPADDRRARAGGWRGPALRGHAAGSSWSAGPSDCGCRAPAGH